MYVLVLAYLVGCSRVGYFDEKERHDRLVRRAYALLENEQYREAGARLQDILAEHPQMPRPHLDLALILHDHGQDYVRAIYHYRRYLDLRPGTEKRAMINARIRQAARSFHARVSQELANEGDGPSAGPLPPSAQPDAATAAAWTRLREEKAALQNDLEKAQDRVAELTRALEEERRGLQQLQAQNEKLQSRKVATGRIATSDAPARAASSGDVPRTYTVRPNDSLSVIAHRVYGDAAKWRVIQDANRELLGDSVALRIGQVLVIP